MRQRVVWSERCQGHRRCYGGFELPGIAQGANQPVMRFDMRRIGRNRLAKSLGRVCNIAAGKQVHTMLRKLLAALRELIAARQAVRLLVRQNWLRGSDHLSMVTSAG